MRKRQNRQPILSNLTNLPDVRNLHTIASRFGGPRTSGRNYDLQNSKTSIQSSATPTPPAQLSVSQPINTEFQGSTTIAGQPEKTAGSGNTKGTHRRLVTTAVGLSGTPASKSTVDSASRIGRLTTAEASDPPSPRRRYIFVHDGSPVGGHWRPGTSLCLQFRLLSDRSAFAS